jgi:arsenate reductase (glutaredoxin)
MKMILYHNKNCSKSRECFSILTKKKIDFEVRDYMKENLTLNEIKHLINNLKSKLEEIIRDKKLFNTGKIINKDKLSNHLLQNPNNMQRPIFFNGTNYYICRPPELVKKLI